MSNPATLRPFQSGYDPRRNTKGRPKGSSALKNLLMKEIKKELELTDGSKMKIEELLVRKVIDIALNDKNADRQFRACKFIVEVIDGKPKATADLPEEREYHISPERRAEVLKMLGIKQNGSSN
ncbi:MAG: hypothetical protein WCO09_00505 [bacterium]